MFNVSNKHKRLMDDWIEKGICVRHKYINRLFKFIWRLLKKSAVGISLIAMFILGVIFYKWIWNQEDK